MKYKSKDWVIDDNITNEDLLSDLTEKELEEIRIAQEKRKNGELKD